MTRFRFMILAIGIGFLSVATVAKRKDAILQTQTDPIAYQEKLKEEVEGKKGPPAPTLALFPRERFLTEPPVEKSKELALVEKEGTKEELEGEEFNLEAETADTKEDRWRL